MQEKTKLIILKIVHIISYVMSALFIILCISLGLGYCNARKSASIGKPAESQIHLKQDTSYWGDFQYNLYYQIKDNNGIRGFYNSQFSFNLDYFKSNVANNQLLQQYGITHLQFHCYDNEHSFYRGYYDYSTSYGRSRLNIEWTDTNISIYGSGDSQTSNVSILSGNYITNEFTLNAFDNMIFKYNEALTLGEGYEMACFGYGSYNFEKREMWNHTNYITINNTYVDVNIEYLYSNLFPIQYQNFDFVGDLNLNSFIGGSSSGYFVYSGTALDFNSSKGVILNAPRAFMCNGKVYNRMRLIATDIDTNTYVAMDTNSGSYEVKKYNGQPNAFYCMYLTYDNTDTNEALMVNQIDFVYREGGGAVHLNHYSWVNDNYKHITILDKDFKKAQDFYEQPGADTLSILQSGLNRSIGYTNTTFDIGSTNVFVLFTTAFSSLGTILSIQILPGITLGLLLFLPLVVGIIIAIIWIVKR